MRQPVRFDPDTESRISHIAQARPAWPAPDIGPRPPEAIRRAVRRNNSTTVRAILAAVLVVLLAMLAYLMSLSSRPSVTGLLPKPGAQAAPGLVTIEAHVGAPKPIQAVTLKIDGVPQTPSVETLGDRSWIVRFKSVLPKGTHQAVVNVRDVNGGHQAQSWSFAAAGPRVSPTVVFTDPPVDATLPQGLVWIHANVQSDADIASATMTVNGKEVPVVLKPSASAVPAATNQDSPVQEWSVGTEHAFPAGTYFAHIVATDTQGDKSDAQFHFTVTNDPAGANVRYFSSANLYVSGKFLTFWESHNGSLLFGDPVGPRYTDPSGKEVQYFENARMEIGHDGQVTLGLLGKQAIDSEQKRVPKPDNFNGQYFEATGHTLAGKFLDFWQSNGGLQTFGYPISEVLDQNGTKVQYFERSRFELAKGDNGTTTVKLTPLGAQIWASMHASTSP